MIRITILLFLLVVASLTYAQTQQQKDSLAQEMCNTISSLTGRSDSMRMVIVFNRHLIPFLNKLPEDQRPEAFRAINLRAQRNCEAFALTLDRLNAKAVRKGDWQLFEEKPETKLVKKICREIPGHKNYRYVDVTGDTVHIEIKKGIYQETFIDGTFSKLSFNWVSDCEFELTFIESNQAVRKNISKPGDTYKYEVLEKHDTYYVLLVTIDNMKRYTTFRLYY
jgi:hypothetical protein